MNKSHLYRLLAVVAMMLPIFIPAKASESVTYADGTQRKGVAYVGFDRAETYNVAMTIGNEIFAGKKITGVAIPVLPTTNVSDFSVWITDNLSAYGASANLFKTSMDFPKAGDDITWMECEIPEGISVGESPLYIGYSFKVTALDGNNRTTSPVLTTEKPSEGELWVLTSRSNRTWKNLAEENGNVSLIKVTLEGDFPANAAKISDIEPMRCVVGKESETSAIITSLGSSVISDLDISVKVGETSATQHIALDEPEYIDMILDNRQINVKIPAVNAEGLYDIVVEVNRVNGVENEAAGISSTAEIMVMKNVPKHRPVVEEYTGTWCGWCVKGHAAMEEMHRLYLEDFIGIAYHSGDPMQIASAPLLENIDFPCAVLDRTLSGDPFYFISYQNSFSLDDAWEQNAKEFAPVDVAVKATWQDADTLIADATADWVGVPDSESTYAFEYVLVGDGIVADAQTTDWWQINNLTKYGDAFGDEELLLPYVNGSSVIRDMVYNDVALLSSGGGGIAGSCNNPEMGVVNSHSFTFDINKVVNTANKKIPFDPAKLKVAVMLVEKNNEILSESKFGKVVNAIMVDVPARPDSGVDEIKSAKSVVSTEFYSLDGITFSFSSLTPGMTVVKVITYSDGSRETRKVFVK